MVCVYIIGIRETNNQGMKMSEFKCVESVPFESFKIGNIYNSYQDEVGCVVINDESEEIALLDNRFKTCFARVK